MSAVNILNELINVFDQERKQNDANHASVSISTHSDDNWSDAEEIDPYNQNTHTECGISNDDEWICVKCNFPNNRRIAITENDCKFVNCNADLSVDNKSRHDEMKSDNINQQEPIKTYISKKSVSKLILSNAMTPSLLPIDTSEIENKTQKQSDVEIISEYENIQNDRNTSSTLLLITDENKQEQILSIDDKNMNDGFLCSRSFEKCVCAN
eukprot:134135_1